MSDIDFTKSEVPLSKFPDCCMVCTYRMTGYQGNFWCGIFEEGEMIDINTPLKCNNICPQFERIKE